MTLNALLSCYDSGREAATLGLVEREAVQAFKAGFHAGRARPLEIGDWRWSSGRAMARRRPCLLRRVFSGVAGIMFHERKDW